MRILIASHLFPPEHSAGVEVFASELAVALVAEGHDVWVFHTSKRVGRRDLGMRRTEYRGVAVFELVNNHFHDSFERTWNHPAIDARFAEVLREVRPDVVHFHHLMYLSIGCLRLARQSARAVLFTPHDFFVECASMGQLVHADGAVCHEVDEARCGTCIPRSAWRQGRWQRRVGGALGRLHDATGVDLGPAAARLAAGMTKKNHASDPGDLETSEVEAFTRAARTRRDAFRSAVQQHVARILCPSRFLMERMRRFGLPSERLSLCPTGIDPQYFAPREDPRSDGTRGDDAPVRVAFIGTLSPIKGAHVLLEAWRHIPEELRRGATLSISGPDHHAPTYVNKLRRDAAELGVEVRGRLSREDVARTLRECDLFAMPSIWFENRPLILHEALSLGVPCLVSAEGGMAELVQSGRDGWHVAMGDAPAWGQRLAEILRDPEALRRLEPTPPEACTWRDAARVFLGHYEAAASSSGPAPS